uniref:Uncharacterized protein n=1 Tax=Oncorhynchus kisutch TaxID=8019 RepID=A0A8C7MB98_ONCKI
MSVVFGFAEGRAGEGFAYIAEVRVAVVESISQYVSSRRPKPFRVTSADHLLNKSIQVAVVGSIWGFGDKTDGTVIDSIQFNTLRRMRNELKPQARKDVAKITFDLYKNNPQDFFGCLNVKATLYGIYSVSYDVRCYAAKKMLKALRWTLFSMQATGHVLLGCSCYIEQLLYEGDRADRGLPPLPQEGKVKQQQSILMGWTAVMGKTVV